MMEPREIEDEGHERVLERVASIDVAKASGMVCVRVPHESRPGRRVSRVWEVPATTRAVIELGDHLVCQGIEKVTVESTSGYWRIWFYLLEAGGGGCGLASCLRHRSANCGTTPGCAQIWSTSGPGTGPGWRSCWKTLLLRSRQWPAR